MIAIDSNMAKMPKQCNKCFAYYGGCCYVQPAQIDQDCPDEERPGWCPLVEIDNNLSSRMTNKDFGTICVCAVRYCLERTTYMQQLVHDFIRDNVDKINDNQLHVIARDIADCKSFSLSIDDNRWWSFHYFLRKTLYNRENERKYDKSQEEKQNESI